jgi:hypothetical protein
MSGKSSLYRLAIRKFAVSETRPGINSGPMAFTQIIENGNFVPLIEQELGANAPDIARAANDEDFHWRGNCSVISGKSKATRQFEAGCRVHLLARVASSKLKGAAEYFAQRFCSSSFRELRPSSERNCVCDAA